MFNDTPMEEVSGVFFLTLLTSLSLCPHSYGGRFWSVLPHCSLRYPCVLTLMEEGSGMFFLTAHFVIPVISLLWRKFLECSSSPCSLRHPCDLTHSYGGRFWSVLPHCSLRHPCDLTHITCVTMLTHPRLFSHHSYYHSLTRVFSHLVF